MGHFNEKTLILRAVMGYAFLRYPLHTCGYRLNGGFVINTETPRESQNLMNALDEFDDVTLLDFWNTRSKAPLNYETGIMHYHTNMKENNVWNYLHQKDFLPILIVPGIMPSFIRENYYVFQLNITTTDVCEFIYEYSRFKEFVIPNINFVIKELNLFRTDIIYNTNKISPDLVSLYRTLMAVGKVWKLYERDMQLDERTSISRYNKYYDYLANLINNIKYFEDDYEINTVIKNFVISFVESHSIDVADITKINNYMLPKIKGKRVILHDWDFYYFPEALLKEICNPLLKSISFLQVKYMLYKEELLICNDTQQKNYTVKKMFYNNETNETIRMRFLKFPKSFFETDEGLPLDMIVNTKSKDNIVRIFKPTGGEKLCISKLEN